MEKPVNKNTLRTGRDHCSAGVLSTSNLDKGCCAKRCSSSISRLGPKLNTRKSSSFSSFPASHSKLTGPMTQGEAEFKNHLQNLIESFYQNTEGPKRRERSEVVKPQKSEDPSYRTSQKCAARDWQEAPSNFCNLDSSLTQHDLEYRCENIAMRPNSNSSVCNTDSPAEASLILNSIGNQLPVNVYEEVYCQMKQLQRLTYHVEKLGEMVQTVQCKHCDKQEKRLKKKEIEVEDTKVYFKR
eukprot:gi/632974692/ref/XP_007903819.1/ PREDICTED: uncharacterized protein LOC103186524 [Callorhinchus milii]